MQSSGTRALLDAFSRGIIVELRHISAAEPRPAPHIHTNETSHQLLVTKVARWVVKAAQICTQVHTRDTSHPS